MGSNLPDFATKVTNRIMGTVEAIPPDTNGEKHMSGEWQLDSLESILMRRDRMTQDEARDLIKEMRERAEDGEDPEELLHEVGLEPDYVWDIIG